MLYHGKMACGFSDIVDQLVFKCLFLRVLALITSSTMLYHGKMVCGFYSDIVDLVKLDETTFTPTGVYVSDFHHHHPPATMMYTGGTIRALVGGNIDKVDAMGFMTERFMLLDLGTM